VDDATLDSEPRRRALLRDHLPAAVAAAHHAEQRQGVDAEDPAGDDRHRNAAQADAAAADAESAAAAAHAANVLDVAALFLAVHAHVVLPASSRWMLSPRRGARLSAERLRRCQASRPARRFPVRSLTLPDKGDARAGC